MSWARSAANSTSPPPLCCVSSFDLLASSSRLILDLSAVTGADASGLAVLVGTGHRAELLGGFLRLAAPRPPVAELLRTTGLDQKLEIFPTAQAALSR